MTENKYPQHPNYPEIAVDSISKAIWAVMSEIGYVQKQKTAGLNYTFAGEASLIRALRPFMEKYGIIMSVVDTRNIEFETYQTKSGATMNRVHLLATIRFTHAPSNTSVDVTAPGEGADSGDKATNKANTCAYKYALRQTFVIETGDDPDETSSKDQERFSATHTMNKVSNSLDGNGKTKTYADLLDFAQDRFKMEETRVKTVLSKYKKFDPTDWEKYIADLSFASTEKI